MKTLLLLTTFLASTAYADSKTLQLGFQLANRHYGVRLAPDSCGSVEAKARDQHDEIKVCAKPDGTNIRLDIDWMSRQNDHEIRNHSSVIATTGQSFELDGGTTKLGVSVL